jgi:hypothetical protein
MADVITFATRGIYDNRKADYRGKTDARTALPDDARAAATAWFQSIQDSGLRPVTALLRLSDSWWLMYAQSCGNDGPRRLYEAKMAKLKAPPERLDIVPYLRAFAEACKNKSGPPPETMEAPPTERFDIEPGAVTLAQVALALAVGVPASLRAELVPALLAPSDPPYERWVDFTSLPWVALVDAPPKMEKEKRPGLFLTKHKMPLPADIEEMYKRKAFEINKLNLCQLIKAPETAAERQELVRCVLGLDAKPPEALSPKALEWLAGAKEFPAARMFAFEKVTATQFEGLLGALVSASSEELAPAVKRLGLSHEDRPNQSEQNVGGMVANALRKHHAQAPKTAPLDGYFVVFPDAPPRPDLLSDEDKHAWKYLCEVTSQRPIKDQIDRLLQRLGEKWLEAPFTPARVAAAAAVLESESARLLFPKMLKRLLFPGRDRESDSGELAHALYYGSDLKTKVTGRPKLEPQFAWLRAIKPDHFLKCRDLVDRAWWLRGVEEYQGEAAHQRALQQEFQYELVRQSILKVGAKSLDADLLRIGKAPWAAQLVSEDQPKVRIDPKKELEEGLGELIDFLLSQGLLWKRLEPPLTTEQLDWVAKRARKFKPLLEGWVTKLEGKAYLGLEQGGFQNLAPLLDKELALVQLSRASADCDALKQKDILEQVIDAATAGGPDELDKRRWLRCRLCTGEPLPQMPYWSAFEMRWLLPLLDPINDVVLVTLNRPPMASSDEEELLTAVLQVLDEEKPLKERPRAGLPCNPAWRTRRPRWWEELKARFGWGQSSAPGYDIGGKRS